MNFLRIPPRLQQISHFWSVRRFTTAAMLSMDFLLLERASRAIPFSVEHRFANIHITALGLRCIFSSKTHKEKNAYVVSRIAAKTTLDINQKKAIHKTWLHVLRSMCYGVRHDRLMEIRLYNVLLNSFKSY